MNYFNHSFITIYLIALIGIIILKDFIIKYGEYSKNKDTKVKYLPCIAKSTMHYGWYIIILILLIPNVLHLIRDIKFYIKFSGDANVVNMYYNSIPYFLILCTCFFIASVCGNIMLINDKFVVFYSGRINFGEVNSVDVFPIKGILRRRKIDIYVNGKLHTRFSIRNKYTCDIINIFKDRCTML